MPIVELSGGPWDGQRLPVEDEELLGRFEFVEERTKPLDVIGQLRAGEVVSVTDWENAGSIIHTYSRTQRRHNGAIVYEHVRVS